MMYFLYFLGEFPLLFGTKPHWCKNQRLFIVHFHQLLSDASRKCSFSREYELGAPKQHSLGWHISFIKWDLVPPYSGWIFLCSVTVRFVFWVLSFDFPPSQVNCWVCTNSSCRDKSSKISKQERGLPLFISRYGGVIYLKIDRICLLTIASLWQEGAGVNLKNILQDMILILLLPWVFIGLILWQFVWCLKWNLVSTRFTDNTL